MKVSEIMTFNVVTVSEEADLDWVEQVMQLASIRHIPVVSGNRLVGLITKRDLLRASVSVFAEIAQEEHREILRSVPVREIMQRKVVTVTEDADLVDAAASMLQNKYGCLPVVRDDELVGILTESDFVRLTRDLLLLQKAQDTP